MSFRIYNNLDLNLNQLLNGLLQQLGSDISPAAGNKGQFYYLTSTNLAKVSNGTTLDTITNILESVSISTANGLSVGAVSSKNQALSLALATSGVAGAMPGTDKTKLDAATNLNTISTIVMRDGSGNFTAGTITATTFSGALAASNLTGTLTHTFISDFDTQVRLSRLDQMAAPSASVSMNSQLITNLLTPVSATDAATKGYVDSTATGLDVKASVRVASTANVTQATYNATGGTSARGQMTATTNSIDGVTLVAGNRILLKNQTTGAQNGIWAVTTAGTGINGTWDRATDFDQDAEVTAGAFTFVEEGTTNSDTGWVLTTNNPIIIGGASGTSLGFAQFSSAGSFTAGNGIAIGGGVISVTPDSTSVNANSLSVSSTGVTIATTYIGQTSITTLGTITTGTWTGTSIAVANGGTGSTTAAGARTNLGATTKFTSLLSGVGPAYTIAHSLGTADAIALVKEVSTGQTVYPDVTVDATNVVITFAVAQTTNAFRVVVVA